MFGLILLGNSSKKLLSFEKVLNLYMFDWHFFIENQSHFFFGAREVSLFSPIILPGRNLFESNWVEIEIDILTSFQAKKLWY